MSTEGGSPEASAIVVEVQVQDESHGLSGERAWASAPGTTARRLVPTFSGDWQGLVTWGATPGNAAYERVPLPMPAPGPMRRRITEIDFSQGDAPEIFDSSMRRAFVVFIPLS